MFSVWLAASRSSWMKSLCEGGILLFDNKGASTECIQNIHSTMPIVQSVAAIVLQKDSEDERVSNNMTSANAIHNVIFINEMNIFHPLLLSGWFLKISKAFILWLYCVLEYCIFLKTPGEVTRGVQAVKAKTSGLRPALTVCPPSGRSEERRVGKECRSRWSPYH